MAIASKAPVKTAAKGISLHMGLNAVSGAAYGGWEGPLAACEFDANDMATLARSKNIKPTVLLTKKATRAAFLSNIRSAAKALKSGDLFFMSYSGHGGQVTDINGEESDHKDETWCLYDGQLIDDELYFELSKFAAGVRIIVLSDSCHSGTVTRAAPPMNSSGPRPRLMPPAVARRTYQAHQAFYDKLQQDVAKAAGPAGSIDPDAVLASLSTASTRLTTIAGKLKPAIVLISGCQDNQTSMDGEHNGLYTENLLRAWKAGKFTGDYRLFHAKVRAGMPATQSPRLYTLGKTAAFLRQKPFTL